MKLDVLQALAFNTSLNPKLWTHLMLECNVSYEALTTLVQSLNELGLLGQMDKLGSKAQACYITPEGLQTIQFYNILKQRLSKPSKTA